MPLIVNINWSVSLQCRVIIKLFSNTIYNVLLKHKKKVCFCAENFYMERLNDKSTALAKIAKLKIF